MISIIIPTLNEEKVIGSTLQKLRGDFTALPYELIVVNSVSTDRTAEITRDYADTMVQEDVRTTIATGKNLGAVAAKGEYLVFMDADMTIPDPNEFFRRALACFERDPRLVGLTVNLRVLPEYETFADWAIFGLFNLGNRIANNFFHAGRAPGEFQMVRRTVFEKLGGYNQNLVAGEDFEFFSRLSKVGRTRLEPTLTALHTGRRAHQLGWSRLLWRWTKNYLSAMLLKRSADKEWEVIR